MHMLARDVGSGSQLSESVSEARGTNGDGASVRSPLNGMSRADVLAEQCDMVCINSGESEHDRPISRMPIGIEKSEPVRLSLGVDVVEEGVIYGMNSGACHVTR